MRDGERIREKTEILLDSRQVVSIVIGSAVVLGAVFYLGVTVGRDLATPGPAAAVDPLAALDRQALEGPLEPAPEPPAELTFPEALTGEPIAEAPPAKEPVAPAKPEPVAPAKVEPPPAKAAPVAPKPPAPKPEPAKASAPAAGGFTVQVGSFPQRAEADALVGALRQQGLAPYVVSADVPGKGVFHRVRLGRFPTRDEAKRYLEDVQREASVSGFVAQVDG